MEQKNLKTRREFLQKSAGCMAGTTAAFAFLGSRAFGANERFRVAVMGVNSRGHALAGEFAKAEECEVAYVCDVDERAYARTGAMVEKVQGKAPAGIEDFRRALDDKNVDALVIAAPDHWHTPAAVLALKAGKHVYVEKPCGHNPREGELLVEAQRKYGKVVQMGNQQRSSPHTIQAISKLREGIIGRPYLGKAWYANTRGSIGRGKAAPVPDWLNYELWQGPAPRAPYKDNVIHYNWHWFWRWGTGEACNNGTHEVDVCRWALGVDFPVRVGSTGGRFHFDDDWEAFDTQVMGFEFEGRKAIFWEGRSCNGRPVEGRGRGAAIYCTEGTLVVDRNGYTLYDKKNKEMETVTAKDMNDTLDTTGAGGSLNGLHIANFLAAVREGAKQHSPIDEGHKSVLLCHLGNIAQRLDRSLRCNPKTGRILDDPDAMKLWSREYEPGWEPRVD